MKSHSNQTRHKIKQEHLVEQMELPKDIFLGMPLLSMEGNRTLCIVNHRGIIKYCPEVIGIATQSYHIRIVGRSLSIRKYSADLIEISGYIQEITFLP